MSDDPSPNRGRVCEIWHVPIGEDPPPRPLLDTLSEEERQQAARFVRDSDRWRYQLCHAALRHVLGTWTGERPERLRFRTGRWGKPALDGPPAGRRIEFNLSHTTNLGLIAVSGVGRLGIDVEAMRSLGDMQAIARRVLSAADYESLATLAPQRRTAVFWAAWTANEACLKAAGSGLGAGEHAIRLDPQARPIPRDPALRLHALELPMPFFGALAMEEGSGVDLVRREFRLPACA